MASAGALRVARDRDAGARERAEVPRRGQLRRVRRVGRYPREEGHWRGEGSIDSAGHRRGVHNGRSVLVTANGQRPRHPHAIFACRLLDEGVQLDGQHVRAVVGCVPGGRLEGGALPAVHLLLCVGVRRTARPRKFCSGAASPTNARNFRCWTLFSGRRGGRGSKCRGAAALSSTSPALGSTRPASRCSPGGSGRRTWRGGGKENREQEWAGKDSASA